MKILVWQTACIGFWKFYKINLRKKLKYYNSPDKYLFFDWINEDNVISNVFPQKIDQKLVLIQFGLKTDFRSSFQWDHELRMMIPYFDQEKYWERECWEWA